MSVEGQEIEGAACAPDSWRANEHETAARLDLFFSIEEDEIAAAKEICADCPARVPCLSVGISERFGVWGGLDALERKQLRRQRRAAVRMI